MIQSNFHVAERGVTQWDAPEIDGSVMVDETIPAGQFANSKYHHRRPARV
jgi:hypothetical protein